MTLKNKLLLSSIGLHGFLFSLALFFYSELGLILLVVETILIVSLLLFIKLIKKALQPLEYIDIFSSLLKEQEFTSRFSYLKQSDLDRLIEQFNSMLQRLHTERLAIGEQQGVFQKLMAESSIGVVLLDFENKISDLNPAAEKLLGIAKENVLNVNLTQLESSDFKYLKSIDVDSHQLVTLNQGRRLKIGHYSIRDRGFYRSFYMFYEMTSEIIESQKSAYEKLIRLMSHEVNNTIAITNSLLESCLTFKGQLNEESQKDFEKAINIVINRSGSLNRFMQGYADIVKLAKPIRTDFNLTKLIKDLTFLFHAECEKQQIIMRFNQEKAIVINADASLIEQATMNILKNAVEAIGNSGAIEIELIHVDNGVQLSIFDTGCGISKEIEQQLFTPFFTSKESGQGVGLMLVRDILTLHGFRFKLTNLEKGACFKIVIPDTMRLEKLV